MTCKMLSAAIKINVAINRALSQGEVSSDEVIKLTATAVNILLYDYIEQQSKRSEDKKREEDS